ncbi:MAG: hypothetical protein JXA21_25340 [Anaerolineae bacterium]|nr:hypothetical protein [Anaerolineae bacterium]
MHIQIVDEAHNRVDWAASTPLVKVLLGLFAGWGILAVLLLPGPGPRTYLVGGVAGGAVLLFALLMALTTPLSERGHLERTPEGGEVYRLKRWLLAGKRMTWYAPLEDVSGFQMEWQTFEETSAATYTLARLWVVLTDGSTALLTDWADVDHVRGLGELLAKAGRRVFEEG